MRVQSLADIRERHPDLRIELTGSVMLSTSFSEAATRDLQTLTPGMYVVLALTVWFLIRSISGTIATLIVVGLSAAAAMGLVMGWMGTKLTPPLFRRANGDPDRRCCRLHPHIGDRTCSHAKRHGQARCDRRKPAGELPAGVPDLRHHGHWFCQLEFFRCAALPRPREHVGRRRAGCLGALYLPSCQRS